MVIGLVALVYNEFECPKCLINRPSFVHKGLMVLSLSSSRLRNCFSLRLDAWKIIYQFLIILSYSSFLLKSYDTFDREMGIRLNFFVLLSTNVYKDYLALLEQSQNSMMLNGCLLKNNLRSFKTAIDCYW